MIRLVVPVTNSDSVQGENENSNPIPTNKTEIPLRGGKTGTEVSFTNNQSQTMTYMEPESSLISNTIEGKMKSNQSGTQIEGKVANHINKNYPDEPIIGVGIEIENTTASKTAGDIDILTDKRFVEVKGGVGSVKKDQLKKYTDPNHANYINHDHKPVVVYLENAPSTLNQQKSLDILKQEFPTIKFVIGLDELDEVLKK